MLLLAEGGFARVYAVDGAVVRKVARAAGDARFAREAEALRAVGPPTVPRFVASGVEADGRPWIEMARVPGETLAARRVKGRGEALALLASAAAAVDAMHAAGWVHRDVKPENLMVGADGRVTLIDLGLARRTGTAGASAEPSLTRTGEAPGTTHYMAPEQAAGAVVDGAADRYALAVVAWELLAGRRLWPGDEAAVRDAHASARVPRVFGGELDAVFAEALAKRPERRFAGAREMIAAVAAAAAATAAAAAAETTTTAATVTAAAAATPTATATIADTVTALVQVRADVSALAGETLGRVLGDRLVLVVPLARAREVAAGFGDAVIHVATLRRVVVDGATVLTGAALVRAEKWWPAGGVRGVVLTEEAQRALGDLADRPPPPDELIGREALEAEILAQLAAGHLVVLVGAAGLGKTHVIAAVARALAGRRVIRLDRRVGFGGGDWALERLLGALGAELPAGAPLDAPGARDLAITRAAVAALARQPSVVVLDDADQADAVTLDILERSATPALVAATALPRPGFGEARTARVFTLAPLAAPDARALLRRLLLPAEFIADELLDGVAAPAAGSPRLLVELAEALWRAGAVRRHVDAAHWYVAPDELLAVSATPLSERLADRLVATLPPLLVATAELAALLADHLTEPILDAVARRLPDGDPAGELDAGVALARLARAGLLVARGDGFSFADPLVASALLARLPPARRTALHAAAHAAFAAAPVRAAVLEPLAQHARGAGATSEARAAFAELGEQALAAQRWTRAEQHLSAALALDPPAGERPALLAARARARFRGHRLRDALDDARAARAALAGRDPAAAAGLLLDEATMHDWLGDFAAAAEATAAAAPLVAAAGPATAAALAARLALAEGRAAFRAEDFSSSAARLAEAAAGARDHETGVIALLLRGTALTYLGRLDDAEADFAAAEARCLATGDALHLGVVLVNRTALWTRKDDHDRHVADARRAVALGRELGNLALERAAAYDLAEHLHARGDHAGALPLAERSAVLARRLVDDRPPPDDAILLARLYALLDRPADARAQLDWVASHAATPSPSLATMARLASFLIDPPADPSVWADLVAEARRTTKVSELAEVLAAARAAGAEVS